jgi:hypothetical protein
LTRVVSTDPPLHASSDSKSAIETDSCPGEGEALDEGLRDALGDVEAEGLVLADGLTEGDSDALGERLALGDTEGDPEALGD